VNYPFNKDLFELPGLFCAFCLQILTVFVVLHV